MLSPILKEQRDRVHIDDDQDPENVGPVMEGPSACGSDVDDDTEDVVLPCEKTDQVNVKGLCKEKKFQKNPRLLWKWVGGSRSHSEFFYLWKIVPK